MGIKRLFMAQGQSICVSCTCITCSTKFSTVSLEQIGNLGQAAI